MRLLVICFFWISTFVNVTGQENRLLNTFFDFAEVSLFSHSVSLPLSASNQLIGLNRSPGISIGLAKSIWKKREKLTTNYFLSFSAYHQKKLHYGLELSNTLLAQYRLFSKINIDGGVGVGYLHTFEDAAVYKQTNGQYEQVSDWGRPQGLAHALIGTSVGLSNKINLVAHYKFLLQLPFARKGGVFFIPHSRFSIGVRINLLDHE